MTITLPGAAAADPVPLDCPRELVCELAGRQVRGARLIHHPVVHFDSTRQPLPMRDPANFAG
jgi:hypothetical protein